MKFKTRPCQILNCVFKDLNKRPHFTFSRFVLFLFVSTILVFFFLWNCVFLILFTRNSYLFSILTAYLYLSQNISLTGLAGAHSQVIRLIYKWYQNYKRYIDFWKILYYFQLLIRPSDIFTYGQAGKRRNANLRYYFIINFDKQIKCHKEVCFSERNSKNVKWKKIYPFWYCEKYCIRSNLKHYLLNRNLADMSVTITISIIYMEIFKLCHI